jgi:glycosyltransferase involved in cell wall biosynthesis
MPDSADRFGIVVLAYNRWEFTRETVTSMLDAGTGIADITIADNASTDETPSLETHFGAHVRYVRFAENLKAAAVNRLWAQLPHAYLMRSDNDLLYGPDWDRRLLAVFRTLPAVGGVSPMFPSSKRPCDTMVDAEPLWYPRTNTTGTVAIRRLLFDRGLRWNSEFPGNDAPFSSDIRSLGFDVAAIDAADNVGFRQAAIEKYPDYYLRNYELKFASNTFGGQVERDRYVRTLKRLGLIP